MPGGSTSAFSVFGRFMTPEFEHQLALTGVDQTTSVGGVIQVDTGNQPFRLACVSAENAGTAIVRGLRCWETYASGGAALKLAHRVWFLRNAYTTPIKGAAFKLPATMYDVLGHIDIAEADYIAYDSDGTAADGFAVAEKNELGLRLWTGLAHRDVWVLPVALEIKTLLASAKLNYSFSIERR